MGRKSAKKKLEEYMAKKAEALKQPHIRDRADEDYDRGVAREQKLYFNGRI